MRSKNKISLIAAVMLLLPKFIFAAATGVPDKGDSYNMVLISLVSLMLILLFVIGMLANTLSQLTHVLKDRNRSAKNDKSIAKAILLLITFGLSALQSFAAEVPGAAKITEKAVAPVSKFISGIPKDEFYAILTVITLELLVIFALVIYIRLLLAVIANKTAAVPDAKRVVKRSWFWDKFNAAVPLEKEKDMLLDHNYDGIQELDNSLPPWWKYGFYVTIVVACIYIYRYHISNDGPSQKEEFTAEMQKGEEDKAAYLAVAGNNIDENNVKLLTDAADIAAGKEIFVKTCAPCHLADGGGIVGPNLTDEYWLHGGGIKDIFKTIKYGWQDKGMKSWKDDFSAKQIQQLASFVKSLKGTKPATPKAPQGEIYIEAAQATPAADSSKKPTDSTTAKKVAAVK
jgi:cytochrome c oxidase cbb3-type subunit III